MALLKKWRDMAYAETTDKGTLQRMWTAYFEKEKEVYVRLLKESERIFAGTVKELAEEFNLDIMTMTGFLDGINDSLKEPNPISEMEEETLVKLDYDRERLYKNMIAANADWLYELPEWDDLFDKEKQKELYREQKSASTVVKGDKIYPNDPCPCGSGRKYKKCCGKN